MTYGDGVSNINLKSLYEFHMKSLKIATVSAVRPPSRFGELSLNGDNVESFEEKPQMNDGYINGGFFVFNKKLFNFLEDDDNCDLEFGALQKIAELGQMNAFRHNDFWQCMDNIREKNYLNQLAKEGNEYWLKS